LDLNRIVSYSLRVGVLISAILSGIGILVWSLSGFPMRLDTSSLALGSILVSAVQGSVVGIVYLAVIILIATPVVRIIISSTYFVVEKDRKFVAITLGVLTMMLFAIFFIPR
jgi:uncharacterized membrane protein